MRFCCAESTAMAIQDLEKIVKLNGTRQYFLIDSASSCSADLLSQGPSFANLSIGFIGLCAPNSCACSKRSQSRVAQDFLT
jgi:hypothetical protein